MEIKYFEHPSKLKRATNIFSTDIEKDRQDFHKINIEKNEIDSNSN